MTTQTLGMDQWLDRAALGTLPDDWYREDPRPRPTITVKEAFDLGIVPEAKLLVRWSGTCDSEENPPARTVTYIHAQGTNYLVRAQDLVNTCPPGEELEIALDGIQAKLLYGAWLKMRRHMLDLNRTVDVFANDSEPDIDELCCEYCAGMGEDHTADCTRPDDDEEDCE